ncbi:uncharacterized protein LOC144162141 [Haemaphysalis longicornis]
MFLLLLNNFSGVYMWLQYMSFTYSLMGFFLAIHSVFSSNDSSTTVFSTLYYGVGAISFLAGGFTAISKGSEGFLGTVVGTISVGLGAFMIIFTVWGSQI